MLEPGSLKLGPRPARPWPPAKNPGPRSATKILHVVTDALPSTSAGYTIRTQEIALAQRFAGMDPHVSTRIGFPVTAGAIDGRETVTVDGVPYHRLLPWVMPGRMDRLYQAHLRHAARLTERLQPAVLHAASNYANAVIALALREATGLPVVYEVRGFWEDTWLSRHAANADLKLSDRYVRTRALETHCMTDADLVVTLGEAMREEIIAARGARGQRHHRPQRGQRGLSPPAARRRRAQGQPRHPAGRARRRPGLQPGRARGHRHPPRGRQDPQRPGRQDAGPDRRRRPGADRAAAPGRRPWPERHLHRPGPVRRGSATTTRSLDVFVVPRTPDRVCQLVTPLKPVEAMASGLPVVVSSVRALSEIVHDRETGLLSPPLDAGELADRLQQLLASPDLRAKLGANARDWVARDRTWAHNAARYREAYQRLGAL